MIVVCKVSRALAVFTACTIFSSVIVRSSDTVQYKRVLPLATGEGVFAYARISPSGRFLAYTSESNDTATASRPVQILRVVDLASKRTIFGEPGRDGYWSVDGDRLIFISNKDLLPTVAIWHRQSGETSRGVAPVALGDYLSWGHRNARDLILTIKSNYYYLSNDRGVPPESTVVACPDIGVGERPLLSKDGKRITTFVRGTIVVRDLTGCSDIIDTGMRGAKADFSWDDRYIAFHTPKRRGGGFEIAVVDLAGRSIRRLADLPGSSYFPSWTENGQLCFRYDDDAYRGFLIAANPLAAPAEPLPKAPSRIDRPLLWDDIFPEMPAPRRAATIVVVWAPWSAHSPDALRDLQRLGDDVRARSSDVEVLTAVDAGRTTPPVERMRNRFAPRLPVIELAPQRVFLTDAFNQIPATLLFRNNRLVERRLGAQSFDELRRWLEEQPVENRPEFADWFRTGDAGRHPYRSVGQNPE